MASSLSAFGRCLHCCCCRVRWLLLPSFPIRTDYFKLGCAYGPSFSMRHGISMQVIVGWICPPIQAHSTRHSQFFFRWFPWVFTKWHVVESWKMNDLSEQQIESDKQHNLFQASLSKLPMPQCASEVDFTNVDSTFFITLQHKRVLEIFIKLFLFKI